MNREEWLMEAANLLNRECLTPQKVIAPMDKVQVSVGFPHRGGKKGSKAIGQCWSAKASTDGRIEIFICPTLDKPVEVMSTLIHEMIHAAVGNEAKHGPIFKKAAVAVGLEGKMTATIPSAALITDINDWLKELPEYPHARLNIARSPITKQGTRLLKVQCPACEYTVRTTAKWIEVGYPTCPCGEEMKGE